MGTQFLHPKRGTAAPPTFRPMSDVAKRSPISATAELLFHLHFFKSGRNRQRWWCSSKLSAVVPCHQKYSRQRQLVSWLGSHHSIFELVFFAVDTSTIGQRRRLRDPTRSNIQYPMRMRYADIPWSQFRGDCLRQLTSSALRRFPWILTIRVDRRTIEDVYR